eukprot:TRINITY_DN2009_c1_g1_i1.p1 TRINITY_DN2009_c1_g1~~TRINITY_DN2009_c1_g1_i1.p1  ORF type:complete len:278 (+),score=31.29 TRINITY_DN2009_c1_g1_i1:54-836(+)
MPFVELDTFRVSGRVSQTEYVLRSTEYQILAKNGVEAPPAPDVMQPISKKEWLGQLRAWEATVKELATDVGKEPKYKIHRPGQLPGLVLPVTGAVPLSPILDISRNSSLSSSVASTPGPLEGAVDAARTPRPEKKVMYSSHKVYPKSAVVSAQESVFLALERQSSGSPSSHSSHRTPTSARHQHHLPPQMQAHCITPFVVTNQPNWGSPLTPPPKRPQTTLAPPTHSAFTGLDPNEDGSPGSSSRILRMLKERNILSEEQ